MPQHFGYQPNNNGARFFSTFPNIANESFVVFGGLLSQRGVSQNKFDDDCCEIIQQEVEKMEKIASGAVGET